jgi:sortase A
VRYPSACRVTVDGCDAPGGEQILPKGLATHSSSLSRRCFLRWAQGLLWVVTLMALGSAGFMLIRAQAYQSYQRYAFRQALQDKPASLIGFLSQWVRHGSSNVKESNQLPAPTCIETGPGTSSRPAPAPGFSQRAHPAVSGSPIGQLEIPRLHLSVIILEGTDDRTLRLGLGHIQRTALPGNRGNAAIAGHRDTFFRPLRDIRKGDVIQITTLYGSFRYSVQSTEVVNPQDTWVLKASSRPALTLVTCYPFYFVGAAPKRFVVHSVQTGAVASS